MSDLYDQIASQRGTMGRLKERIPAFRGYQERGDRRTADRMLRDHIAEQLEQRINRLAQLEKRLLDKDGGMSYMSRTRSAKDKLQTFHDRVKAAAPGYSGFFAKINIDSDELSKLYAFDEAQVRYADRFGEALDTLEQAITGGEAAGIEAAIINLDSLAIEANEAFVLREDVLTNLDKALGA
ncbi:MAG: hypothetical protein H7175_14645 [Burkholderiales bacterium]|nr:hypothetical protein [Anaerolineae bacterium]